MNSSTVCRTTPPRPSGRRRRVAALSAAAVTAALVVAPATTGAAASGAAPGAPGTPATWALGDHDGFGTARGTSEQGLVHPARRQADRRLLPAHRHPEHPRQPVRRDGKRFTDREDRDARSKVELLDSRSLVYRVTTTAKSGKWRIVKTFVTDPARSTVLQRVRFTSLTGAKYQLFLLHDPALTMNRQRRQGSHRPRPQPAVLGRHDIERGRHQPAMTRTSSGYLGTSDGWTDLKSDHRMDWT